VGLRVSFYLPHLYLFEDFTSFFILTLFRHIRKSEMHPGATVSRLTILQHFPNKSDALNLLLQREWIEEVSEGYRFQVELIRHWFA
ncbi:hypothetical protein, partial [Microcoleus vaginatus]|uniref:hypothetical protein n=1 Tax=Microcoleus vaginatus TaxID=119532 RepID=UPI0032AAEEEB